MKILNKKIAVEKINTPSKSLITKPGDLETEPHFAKVTHVSNDIHSIKTGEIVLYRAGAGEEIDIDGIQTCVMNLSDVIATMSNQKEYYDLST